ncbi:nuclear transport factor 2 family protein [Rhodococcus sp. X156]|uniref:nuclear transport factor 2 family protein n=1 Tax=Rhodococcus sp. X156 TaxID=2499145 RepID=UPI000FDCCADE|nr:nuclear transport factor 2 family protein [Rhodococcus sp. X156]
MSTSEIATVLAWHDALTGHDLDTLLNLSSDDVELATPTGASQGIAALREWAERFRGTVSPGRMFVHHGVVVVEEELSGAEQEQRQAVATAFRVVHDQVTSVFRHDSLAEALADTGLLASDEVTDG